MLFLELKVIHKLPNIIKNYINFSLPFRDNIYFCLHRQGFIIFTPDSVIQQFPPIQQVVFILEKN